jgi:hypothetical protein
MIDASGEERCLAQLMRDRETSSGSTSSHLKLVEDVAYMPFYGVRTDVQLTGDLWIGQSGGK